MAISSNLPEWIQKDLEDFRREHTVDAAMQYRLAEPQIPYFGDEVLTMAIAALLQGERIPVRLQGDRQEHPRGEPGLSVRASAV